MLVLKDVELWSPIEGYDGYEVSSHGRVRSFKCGAPQILKPGKLPSGHLQVLLYREGALPRSFKVHRLVLLNFVGPPAPGQICRHLDGDPTNNHEDNLCWGTYAENEADAVRHGTKKGLTKQQVQYVLVNPKGLSNRALADELGVSHSAISRVLNGRNHTETVQELQQLPHYTR